MHRSHLSSLRVVQFAASVLVSPGNNLFYDNLLVNLNSNWRSDRGERTHDFQFPGLGGCIVRTVSLAIAQFWWRFFPQSRSIEGYFSVYNCSWSRGFCLLLQILGNMTFTPWVLYYLNFIRGGSGISARMFLRTRNHYMLPWEVYHLRCNGIRQCLTSIVLCLTLPLSLRVLTIFLSHCYPIS